jgi:hypothetical protein
MRSAGFKHDRVEPGVRYEHADTHLHATPNPSTVHAHALVTRHDLDSRDALGNAKQADRVLTHEPECEAIRLALIHHAPQVCGLVQEREQSGSSEAQRECRPHS